jgi:sortase A
MERRRARATTHRSRRALPALLVAVSLALAPVAAGAAPAAPNPAGYAPRSSRQPVIDRTQSLGFVTSRIQVPSLGIDLPVYEGVAPEVLDKGVGHWVGTALPGDDGNVVLAGHRTTHSAPFRDLDRLEIGALIYLTNRSDFEVMYRVTDVFVVTPDDMWITFDGDHPTVTLFACHPKGSARQRIVVQAEMVGGPPVG